MNPLRSDADPARDRDGTTSTGAQRFVRLAAVLLLLALLWGLYHGAGLHDHFSVAALQQAFERHRLGGLLLFAALFALGNLMQIPGWIFLVAAVLALGRVWGGLATYFAACLSCVVSFGVIRLVGANALRAFKGAFMTRLFAQLDAHPLRTVICLRLLFQTAPALNVALALSGVRFRSYLLGSVLGLPASIAVYVLFFDKLAAWLGWPVH